MKNIIYTIAFILIAYTLFRNSYEIITSMQILGGFSQMLILKIIISITSLLSLYFYFSNENLFKKLSILILIIEPLLRVIIYIFIYRDLDVNNNVMLTNIIIFSTLCFFTAYIIYRKENSLPK